MDVLMPQLGETVAEGKITKWFKSAGEPVKPGDNLFEIETDKVSMEVPSTTTGVLSEIRVAAGEVAPVGAVVAVIADGAGAATSRRLRPLRGKVERPSPPPLHPRRGESDRNTGPRLPMTAGGRSPLDPFFEVRTPERNFGPARLPGGIAVTPLARRLAAEAGIDLSRTQRLRSPWPHRRARRRKRAAPSPAPAGRRPDGRAVKALYAAGSYEEVPLDGMRRTIAARLTQAMQTIPHFLSDR